MAGRYANFFCYFFYFLYIFLTLLPFPLYQSPSNCHSTAPPPSSNYKKVCSQLVVSQPLCIYTGLNIDAPYGHAQHIKISEP